jgi:hypothetical protein
VQALRDAAEIEDAKEAGRKKGLLSAATKEGQAAGEAQYEAAPAAQTRAPAPASPAVPVAPAVELELGEDDEVDPWAE